MTTRMRQSWLLKLLAFLASACVPHAAPPEVETRTPPLIPIEELFADPSYTESKLSPDGRRLAYFDSIDGRLGLWVRELPDGAGRPLPLDSERPIGEYRWTLDSQRILYFQDRGGDESYHLFAIDIAQGSAPRDLTPFGAIEAELVALPGARPDLAVITLNRRDPALADAYRLELTTGRLELAAMNPGTFIGYVSDSDGHVRAARSLDEAGRYSLHVRAREERPWTRLRTYPVEDSVRPLRFDRSGEWLYAISDHGRDLQRLVRIDLASGEESEVDSDPRSEVDLGQAVFGDAGGGTHDRLLATRYEGDVSRWVSHHPRVGKVLELAHGARPGSVFLRSWTADLDHWIVEVEADDDPGATFHIDLEDESVDTLAETRPWLADYPLVKMKPIRLTARDGLTLRGYLSLPLGQSGPRGDLKEERVPLVLAVHGGPWARDVWGFAAETQMLANRGYAVLQVNYRGSTGFGKRFAQAAKKQFGRAMQTDLLDAVDWAVSSGFADPDRIAILGGSYGGYAVLQGLASTPEVFACGVDYAGPSNLVTLIESFPPSWRPFLPRRWHSFVGDPADPADRADLLRRSPLLSADRIEVPLLVFQGANDPRVTPEQSETIVRALTRRGIPVTYLLAGNEGHSFGQRETALAVNRATEVFLGRCLGGRVQESVASEVEDALRSMHQERVGE